MPLPVTGDIIAAARDVLEHGCLDEEFPSFVTGYGYSHYLASRP